MSRKIISDCSVSPLLIEEGLSDDRRKESFLKKVKVFGDKVLLCECKEECKEECEEYKFHIWHVYVSKEIHNEFLNMFDHCIKNDNELHWDNLINLCIMVKDAGDGFRDILEKNLPYVDYWTFLDTGSTDNTISIIKDVMKSKPGILYQEPFINFRDSRNRLLELAGNKCFYNIMLDDTYFLNGPLREFLYMARGDNVVDSYSLVIEDTDTFYTSNRITKSDRKLRYINRIHEIIQTENNLNASIPYKNGYIIDVISDYMKNRTSKRKYSDIDILFEELKEKPNDPRTLYYIADSYLGLKKWEMSLEWFQKRVNCTKKGSSSEIQDSLYYIAAISHTKLNKDWKECHQLYLNCYEYDPSRTDMLFLIAQKYLNNGRIHTGFLYLKNVYEKGMPMITMSVRKEIYNYYTPLYMMKFAYEVGEYKLGLDACNILEKNGYKDACIISWKNIYRLVLSSLSNSVKSKYSDKPLICFISPGGWNKWDGSTFYKKGLGGSETFTVRYAETLQKFGNKVVVFCDCEKETTVNDIEYKPIGMVCEFVSIYNICKCIVNRYYEYMYMTVLHNIDTYMVFHDLFDKNTLICDRPKLKGIYCVSKWHLDKFLEIKPELRNKSYVISCGIDMKEFSQPVIKQPGKFIYPSFPNRGLLPLLEMWPAIIDKFPDAELHIFCDTKNNWVQKYHKPVIDRVEKLLKTTKNVINHGWVNPGTLRNHWLESEYWFYPCTFEETCCMVAYEAAASKTLCISNNLAALNESIGDRGVCIPGDDCRDKDWQSEAISRLISIMNDKDNKRRYYIDKNYEWIQTKQYEIVVKEFAINHLMR